ncbi:hypothetical protein EG68_01853 [Paragonimus skrjabini miyazakii]|uniref:Anion exchange protein n=1 Tax=Paragonimus skrjabini miyazakii TaxID=59628 RepID=A0A8S9Z2N7_9TREM|nr:hypothetical protein EG68_01853 [Paragonimus skrjabini miyazakii]
MMTRGSVADSDLDSAIQPPFINPFLTGPATAAPMFIEVQELVSRVRGGLEFDQNVFASPVSAHFRVLWLQTARWVNFEQNYDEVEQRFTEAHISPMRFTRVTQLCEQMKKHGAVLVVKASTLGHALDEVARHALSYGCVALGSECDVLRSVLLAERWHPEVKGQISDVAEFDKYWNSTGSEAVNLAFDPDEDDQETAINKRKDTAQKLSQLPRRSTFHAILDLQTKPAHPYHRYNQALTDCLDPGAEACTVLCGTIEFLRKPLIVLVCIPNGIEQSCASEVNVPIRFIFVYLGPRSNEFKYTKLGRIFAIMMSNSTIFRAGIYEAQTVDDVLRSIDVFMMDALVIPLARHTNPQALAAMVRQIEAYKREGAHILDMDRRSLGLSLKPSQAEFAVLEPLGSRKMSALDLALQDGALDQAEFARRAAAYRDQDADKQHFSCRRRFVKDFCPPFSDLVRGIRPWYQRMSSDYRDAVTKENVGIVISSVLFLYFVNLAPAITFGALMNLQIHSSFTTSLAILSTGSFLTVFTLLSGQPLGFVGITGPVFILESALASVARTANVSLPILRLWVAIYCCAFGLIFITFNVSVLGNHIRRSVEEVFNSFIAFFYLVKSLFTMFRLIPSTPGVGANTATRMLYSKQCAIAGTTLFLAFIKLQFCLALAEIKRGTYFRRTIRKLLGALNVPLGMILITALNQIFFLGFEMPTINIPPSNAVNTSHWFNMPEFGRLFDFAGSAALVHGAGIAIGFALCIIVFTEVALNGITAMKNKAVKANVFVMDLVLMLVIFPIVSGLLGWPFVSGASVRTMSNLVALVQLDPSPAPGMPHRVIGTVEQRVSGTFVGILVALSIFLGSILKFIPLAALYGMFLYMGMMGLRDLQFFQRCLALMKRRKHWEDWEFVRGLPSAHILVFATIQILVIGILVALNVVSEVTVITYAGIAFPLVVIVYAILRETALTRWRWLAIYLHQLDKKYKLDPQAAKRNMSVPRSLSLSTKDASVHAAAIAYHTSVKDALTEAASAAALETDSSAEYSDHEDGVIRRTWAT